MSLQTSLSLSVASLLMMSGISVAPLAARPVAQSAPPGAPPQESKRYVGKPAPDAAYRSRVEHLKIESVQPAGPINYGASHVAYVSTAGKVNIHHPSGDLMRSVPLDGIPPAEVRNLAVNQSRLVVIHQSQNKRIVTVFEGDKKRNRFELTDDEVNVSGSLVLRGADSLILGTARKELSLSNGELKELPLPKDWNRDGSVNFSSAGSLVSIQPHKLSETGTPLFRIAGWVPTDRGSNFGYFHTGAPRLTPVGNWDPAELKQGQGSVGKGDARIAINPHAIYIIDDGSLVEAKLGKNWSPRRTKLDTRLLPVESGIGSDARYLVGRQNVYRIEGSRVVIMPRSGEEACILAPWEIPIAKSRPLIVDESLWLFKDGSATVIQESELQKAQYLRVGEEEETANFDGERRLLEVARSWVGTPYKWGGNDRAGVDCSGFVCAVHKEFGVSLPRTSAEMATTKRGAVVSGELRIGDVLCYPGHVAIYAGNGKTFESVRGGVSQSTLWRREKAVARRFFDFRAGRAL